MSSIIQNQPVEFDSFGTSFISDRALGEPVEINLSDNSIECRKLLRADCPTAPGIYGWLNADRQLIYVGKSKSLRNRLGSYFARTPADPKMHRIRRDASQLVWEPIAHELLALLREQELIHRWRPQYNSQGQPTRRHPAFVCMSDSLAPHAFVAKKLSRSSRNIFGPIVGTGDLKDSIESLNHVFELRDCSDKTKFEFSSQLLLFAETPRAQCIRYELGTCPGPCARVCSPERYRANVDRALDFLNGNDSTTLDELENKMLQAAARQHFERATVLRNQWHSLRRLDRQLGRLRRSETKINGVMRCHVSHGRHLWMVLRAGKLVNSFLEPRSHLQAEAAKQAIIAAQLQQPKQTSDILEINLQLIIAGWFKKYKQDLAALEPFKTLITECNQRIAKYQRAA